jgi:hypothetical protein
MKMDDIEVPSPAPNLPQHGKRDRNGVRIPANLRPSSAQTISSAAVFDPPTANKLTRWPSRTSSSASQATTLSVPRAAWAERLLPAVHASRVSHRATILLLPRLVGKTPSKMRRGTTVPWKPPVRQRQSKSGALGFSAMKRRSCANFVTPAGILRHLKENGSAFSGRAAILASLLGKSLAGDFHA